MRPISRLCVAMACIATAVGAGCAEPMSRGVYEGARGSQDALRSPTEKATQPSRPYEDYAKNRPGKSD